MKKLRKSSEASAETGLASLAIGYHGETQVPTRCVLVGRGIGNAVSKPF
jgi:hypothetical protein